MEYTKVFFLEQLPFYKKDTHRKEDKETATKIHNLIYETYKKLGYEIINVPITDSPEKRIEFIIKKIEGGKKNGYDDRRVKRNS